MLRHASVKKAIDLNRYRFNLIRYTDAKPNLHKPNAITEGRLTVLKTDVKAQGELRQTLNILLLQLTARRQSRRKYEEKNKEQRKETNSNFQTMIPRELYEEISSFLKEIGMTKVQFIKEAYELIKEKRKN